MTSRAVNPDDPRFIARKASAAKLKHDRELEEAIAAGIPNPDVWIARSREVYAGPTLNLIRLAGVLHAEHERGRASSGLGERAAHLGLITAVEALLRKVGPGRPNGTRAWVREALLASYRALPMEALSNHGQGAKRALEQPVIVANADASNADGLPTK